MRRLPAAMALILGCGGDPTMPHDASAPLADGPGSTDKSDTATPTDAATRPANPTCRPPTRPVPEGLEGLPARLTDTGCFEAGNPPRPVPGLIPFTVNVPLWSDGADKERWLALPDGARVSVNGDGDLALPPGTVLIKTFRLGGRPIETRFFVRHPGGEWSGYTYEWNEAGSDATLLDEGSHRRKVGDREWHFPSRAECDQCHTAAAGHSLGLELAQLERPEGSGRQLARLERLGLFEAPLPSSLPAPLPAPDDKRAPLPARARAYLHANCAGCHRPGVGNSGTSDLRHATALASTAICDAEPLKGSLGRGPDHRILAPGAPERSMIVVRMRELGPGRMPSVGSIVVDAAGVSLVSEWIASLRGCE